MRTHSMKRAPRGHTLIEMMVVLATMSLVFGGVAMLMRTARDASHEAITRSSLQESGRRMLETMLDDLRRTGLTTAGGQNYPVIWEHARGIDATPLGPLVATMNYADVNLVSEVLVANGNGDRITRNAGRVSDEIDFQLPSDLDGDGTPLDANGDMEWGADVFLYRVVDDPEGRPWLYRDRVVGGAVVERRPIGPDVVSCTFDVVFNDRSLRFNQAAIVLYLQHLDPTGQLIQVAVEGSVGLRNTREL